MNEIELTRAILKNTLQLGPRADDLDADTPLLGHIPELDSMAVLTVLLAIEDECGVTIEDDEVSAETFATIGSLASFVADKLAT